MKKIAIIINFFFWTQIVVAQVKKHPCIQDSVFLFFLKKQTSYNFDHNEFLRLNGNFSFQQDCLSQEAKSKILALFKGEVYNFEKELDFEKRFIKITIENEAKKQAKKDTIKYKAILDSLYTIHLAEKLNDLKKRKPIDHKIVLFIGEIFFYDAIPFFENELAKPTNKLGLENIKLMLGRMGSKPYYDDFMLKIKIPSTTWLDYSIKEGWIGRNRLNTSEIYYSYYQTELNNNTIVDTPISCNDGCWKKMPIWYSAIYKFRFILWDNLKDIQIEKFGKTVKEMSEEELRTEKVRKGVLEIIEAHKDNFSVFDRIK